MALQLADISASFSGAEMISLILFAKAIGLFVGTSQPLKPSVICCSEPPLRVASAGLPIANDSAMFSPKASGETEAETYI